MGDEWWDEKRKEAYEAKGFRCWACGVPKKEAAFHPWLEGHERYAFDYKKGRMTFVEVVALCHSCHNFIHSGRLFMEFTAGRVTKEKMERIILHGFNVLKKAGLRPWPGTIQTVYMICLGVSLTEVRPRVWDLIQQSKDDTKKFNEETKGMAAWGDWRLVLQGKEYKPLHKSFEDWEKFYETTPFDNEGQEKALAVHQWGKHA